MLSKCADTFEGLPPPKQALRRRHNPYALAHAQHPQSTPASATSTPTLRGAATTSPLSDSAEYVLSDAGESMGTPPTAIVSPTLPPARLTSLRAALEEASLRLAEVTRDEIMKHQLGGCVHSVSNIRVMCAVRDRAPEDFHAVVVVAFQNTFHAFVEAYNIGVSFTHTPKYAAAMPHITSGNDRRIFPFVHGLPPSDSQEFADCVGAVDLHAIAPVLGQLRLRVAGYIVDEVLVGARDFEDRRVARRAVQVVESEVAPGMVAVHGSRCLRSFARVVAATLRHEWLSYRRDPNLRERLHTLAAMHSWD
uniref:Uncharacterized protein n=1 Tax=Neobodo designis TaxID=312471 RepID=A0A7S1L492_NEODS|mmetsp:Transcript_14520/g.45038  ORF Transcript_14520/g.45038 Transcript_14520/m.45038 type:complete len:307 (+) Transcript_14520:260-1180(+)